MSMEKQYYENEDMWLPDRYLEHPLEKKRWEVTYRLLSKTNLEQQKILDAGCGNGAFLKYLESVSEKTLYQLLGLERSKTAILKKLCQSDIDEGSIDAMPYSDKAFDTALCTEVIEHLPWSVYEKAIVELQRVSQKYILLSVPFLEKRRRTQCPYCACVFNPNYHLRSFNLKKLEDLFTEFKLLNYNVINRKSYLFKDLFNPRKMEPFDHLRICPQCGFQEEKSAVKSSKEKRKDKIRQLKDFSKSFWPYVKVPLWFVGLYKRR